MPNLLSRIWSSIIGKAEGQPHSGPWQLPVTGGYLPSDVGKYMNWWQMGYNPSTYGSRFAMVEACLSAYAQTVAQCPGDHWRGRDDGGRDRITNSSLSRILRKPNNYQSISDFMLNATRSLYQEGNTYALALRNDRFEIDQLHLMDPRQCSPQVSQFGDVFYRLGGNDVIDYRRRFMDGYDEQLIVPARDVLHIRLHTERRWPHPLVGETPLLAAYGDIESVEKIKNQQDQFYDNQARPSAVLSTDLVLDKDQVQALRDRWNEQAKGLHAGGVPILTAGLKVQPWATQTGKDLQIAERLDLTDRHIALVFRIPLAILGLSQGTAGNTEQLMGIWLASGLGFCLNHIEESFGHLFNLRGVPDEYVEFDTQALLRSAKKERIDMLVRAVQGGVFSPNEARAREDLPATPYGDEPRVQQQVVPLSAAASIPGPGSAPGPDTGLPVVGGGPVPPAPGPASAPASAGPSSSVPRMARKQVHAKMKRSILGAVDEFERRRIA